MAGKTTDTRQRLLAAAREEFMRCGYEGASLRRIAASVGIAAPSVYNHFASKEALFDALAQPIIQMVKDTFRAVDARKREAALTNDDDALLDKSLILPPVLDFVFDHLEDVKLLLFGAEGTRYAHILDDAAALEADATARVLRESGGKIISPQQEDHMRLIMRHQYQTYAEALLLGYDKARTRRFWYVVSEFYAAGWRQFLEI